MALSAIRKNPLEPAQTRGNRQKKANPEGLVFPLLVAGRNMNAATIPSFKWRLAQRQVPQKFKAATVSSSFFAIVEVLRKS
jgi:hypothetical protein